jgi:hypothetical protein
MFHRFSWNVGVRVELAAALNALAEVAPSNMAAAGREEHTRN